MSVSSMRAGTLSISLTALLSAPANIRWSVNVCWMTEWACRWMLWVLGQQAAKWEVITCHRLDRKWGGKQSDPPSLSIFLCSLPFHLPRLYFSGYTILGFTFVLLINIFYQFLMLSFYLPSLEDDEPCSFFLLPLWVISDLRYQGL